MFVFLLLVKIPYDCNKSNYLKLAMNILEIGEKYE